MRFLKKYFAFRYASIWALGIIFLAGSLWPRATIDLKNAWCLPFSEVSFWGCSPLGQNMGSLVLSSLQGTLVIAVSGRLLALLVSLFGFMAAWLGGQYWEKMIIRLCDVFLTLPALLLALAASFILGSGKLAMILAIAISEWAVNQKWILGRLKEYSRETYIQYSISCGASRWTVFHIHFIYRILQDFVLTFFLFLPSSLLNVAALEFLGLSASEKLDGLGYLIAAYRDSIFLYPHVVLLPTIAIVGIILFALLAKDSLQKTAN